MVLDFWFLVKECTRFSKVSYPLAIVELKNQGGMRRVVTLPGATKVAGRFCVCICWSSLIFSHLVDGAGRVSSLVARSRARSRASWSCAIIDLFPVVSMADSWRCRAFAGSKWSWGIIAKCWEEASVDEPFSRLAWCRSAGYICKLLLDCRHDCRY